MFAQATFSAANCIGAREREENACKREAISRLFTLLAVLLCELSIFPSLNFSRANLPPAKLFPAKLFPAKLFPVSHFKRISRDRSI